ncbi:MAG: ester cyclase [Stellaceae bacterium]
MDRRNLLRAAPLGGAVLAMVAAGGGAALAAAGDDGNKLMDRLIDAINTHDVAKFDQIYASGGYTNHQALLMNHAGATHLMGRDQAKKYFAARFKAFPDVTLRTDIRVASGDLIAANLVWEGTQKGPYLGIPASGKKVAWNSTDILRVRDGFFVEHWGAVDFYGLVKQLKG